jgi:Transposase IS66 family
MPGVERDHGDGDRGLRAESVHRWSDFVLLLSQDEIRPNKLSMPREALWTFVQVDGVEPTNNTAERALRPGVLWRKGSFGTQSEEGSRFVANMMTVVATLKQQQRNVLEYLTAAHEAALRGEAAPSLLPKSAQKS